MNDDCESEAIQSISSSSTRRQTKPVPAFFRHQGDCVNKSTPQYGQVPIYARNQGGGWSFVREEDAICLSPTCLRIRGFILAIFIILSVVYTILRFGIPFYAWLSREEADPREGYLMLSKEVAKNYGANSLNSLSKSMHLVVHSVKKL